MKLLRNHSGEAPLYLWFHENTRLTPSQLVYRSFQFPLHAPKKEYQGFPACPLPASDSAPEMTLLEALCCRKSLRDFDPHSHISLDTLAGILRYAYGVTHRVGDFSLRAAASAGGRYPIEVYIAAQAVEGLDPGLYHLHPEKETLTQMRRGRVDVSSWACNTPNAEVTRTADCLLILTAVFERTIRKYGDRGYRYVMLDAGHLGQNVYLCATAFGTACVGLGGFFEEEVERELGVDGVNESVVYMLALGKPRMGGV